jgi:hypothetical protein
MYLFINRISKISQFFQFFITGFLLRQKIIYFLSITSSRCHFSHKHKTNINKWVTDKWQWNMWPNKRTGLSFPVRTSKKRHLSLTTSLAKKIVTVTMMRKRMLILLAKISLLPLQSHLCRGEGLWDIIRSRFILQWFDKFFFCQKSKFCSKNQNWVWWPSILFQMTIFMFLIYFRPHWVHSGL